MAYRSGYRTGYGDFATENQRVRFYRNGTRLVAVDSHHSSDIGFVDFEEVSEPVSASHDDAMDAVTAAWAAESGGSAAALRTALHADLQAAGIRRINTGADLT